MKFIDYITGKRMGRTSWFWASLIHASCIAMILLAPLVAKVISVVVLIGYWMGTAHNYRLDTMQRVQVTELTWYARHLGVTTHEAMDILLAMSEGERKQVRILFLRHIEEFGFDPAALTLYFWDGTIQYPEPLP
jgi:hypothetical protein